LLSPLSFVHFSILKSDLLKLEPETQADLPTVEELKKANEIITRGLSGQKKHNRVQLRISG
jgi:hypothetical protein